MPSRKNLGLFVMVSALTILLSAPASMLLLASIPARYLRLSFGRWLYWTFALSSSVGLFFIAPYWAFAQFVVLLAIGLYTDLEQTKVPIFYSGAISVFFTSTSIFLLLGAWARTQQTNLATLLTRYINSNFETAYGADKLPPEVSVEAILSMFPAIVAFSVMLVVGLAVIFIKSPTRNEKLTAFKAPDALIWAFIIGLAGMYLLPAGQFFWAQKTATNLLYFCAAAYYFQGLAIAGFFIQRTKVNYFLKLGIFSVLATYLFIFVAVLGLSDVWFSYRSKWYQKLLKDNPRSEL